MRGRRSQMLLKITEVRNMTGCSMTIIHHLS
jgi:hypothetical protein